jgi:two-component system response regulator PilR (NtrC family)
MKRLLLVEPDETVGRELGAYLRSDGHEVLEIDKQRALELCHERVDAVFVWTTREAARAAAVLRQMDGSPQPRILFYAGSERAAAGETTAPALVGETTAMRDLRATLRLLAGRPRTHVLVGGEPGSGKHTVARGLHHATNPRHDFVHLTAARLSRVLERGVRSFEAGATLYLPSIEAVERSTQRALAELLADQDGFNAPPVRLVIGLMRSGQQVSLGRLVQRAVHPELAARVPVLLDLLPLRKRKSDIPLLASHLLSSCSPGPGASCPLLSPAALERLVNHGWPGNVRELANVLERASLSGRGRIEAADLPAFDGERAGVDYELPSSGIDIGEFERAMLVQALALSRGNQTQAASLLGLTRDQIRYRMNKFKIPRSPNDS